MASSSSSSSLRGSPTRLLLLLVFVVVALLASAATAENNNPPAGDDNNDNANAAVAAFIPTQDNFVTSSDSAALLDEESMMSGPPQLKLSYWTTPHRDWDSTLLMRIKPLVVRFQKHMMAFHPHQGIIDGSLIGCHDPKQGGQTDISKLSEACLDNCVNAGRYCAVFFPNHVDKTHAGLTGADLVMESSRRLCIWIQYGNKNTNEAYKFFDYIQSIRDTSCDLSLSDNCIDRVYREVGIDDKKVADCMHDAGGVGSQVDMKNAILLGEGHRGSNINLTYDELPHMAINGEAVENVTTMSDWQIMAEVCTNIGSGSGGKGGPPKLCEFCMWECPKGNDDHDPTQQCLWDLTCGDDRTFDDWMKGTGPFAGNSAPGSTNNSTTNNTTDTTTNVNDVDNNKEEGKEEEETTTTTDVPSTAPTAAPTDVEKGDEQPGPHNDDLDKEEVEDLGGNSTTNTTSLDEEEDLLLPEDHSNNEDTNATTDVLQPPPPNPAGNSSSTSHQDEATPPTPTPTPTTTKSSPAPTPAPHHSKPSYNSPIAPLKPTTHHHNAPTTTSTSTSTSQHGGKGNTNVPPQPPLKKKSPNTTNPAEAVEGLAIAVVCLAGIVVGVYWIQRYRSGKDVYATVDHRDANGLASTASHSITEQDLELHVEISSSRLGRKGGGGSRSDGYAPPSKGTWG